MGLWEYGSMGFHILKCAASTGDIGNQILELKTVYQCSDLSDLAIFQFSIYK